MNYFDLYEINNSFEVDKNLIEKKYIELQKQYQPDRARDDLERISSIQALAEVNNAYKTLKDDYLRGVYILKLQNIDLLNDRDLRSKMPFEILNDILQKREESERLNEIGELEIAKSKALVAKSEIVKKIQRSFEASEQDDVIVNIMHLKYHDNLINIIDKKIEECF